MKGLEKKRFLNSNLLRYALTEKNVMVLNNSPFIVKLFFAFQTVNKLFLVLELG
jgi:hypothetical protein